MFSSLSMAGEGGTNSLGSRPSARILLKSGYVTGDRSSIKANQVCLRHPSRFRDAPKKANQQPQCLLRPAQPVGVLPPTSILRLAGFGGMPALCPVQGRVFGHANMGYGLQSPNPSVDLNVDHFDDDFLTGFSLAHLGDSCRPANAMCIPIELRSPWPKPSQLSDIAVLRK